MMFSFTIVFNKKWPWIELSSAKGKDWVYTYATRKHGPARKIMLDSFMKENDVPTN